MTTDVTINSVGYMVQPGSYRADSVVVTSSSLGSAAELSPSQRSGRDIATTLGTRGAVAGGLGGLLPHVGPNFRPAFPIGEAGIGPPPLAIDRGGANISTDTARVGLGTEQYGFITSSDNLYRWTTATNTLRKSAMGQKATGMAVRGDRDLFIAFGSAQDVARWEDDTGTYTAQIFGVGEQADLITMLADRPVVVKPGEPTTIYIWTATFSSAPSFELNGAVLAMLPVGDGILIATDQSWYILEDIDGAPGQVLPTLRPTTNASEVTLAIYRGAVYAAVDGALYRRSSLTGGWIYIESPGDVSQLVTAGRWLYTRIDNEYGASGIWVTDGATWFYVQSTIDQLMPGPSRIVGGVIDNDADIEVLNDTDPDDASNYATVYQAATALQGATLARNKDWSQIGAEFHRPDNEQVGSWSAQLQYSVDAGRTWSNAGTSQTVDDEHERIVADLSSVTARVLLVRVNLTASSGLAPVLAALWADWSVTDADGGGAGSSGSTVRTHVRRWRLVVLAQDGLIDREGALLGLSASTIRSNLWARLNLTSSFTDIDGTVQATTTITNIEEVWPSPADQPDNVSTRMELTIIEGDQTI